MLTATDFWSFVWTFFGFYVALSLVIVALEETTNKYYVMAWVAWLVVFLLFVKG